MFVYCPAAAVPVAVQVMVAPVARVVAGQLMETGLSSVTVTASSGTLPAFVTMYFHVIGLPAGTSSPGGRLLSVSFVVFTSVTAGAGGISPKLLSCPLMF